eukprot:CAMPEP_0172078594 /NCGR_PEP_ID=MMETSP1043-20130122/17707_1 /TAXON_ID=464988 /ORGANISM="Hemiselmis andersenii, Strain CCMP441" /LENGTH=62 /DNA_ID=CAMNT_0012739689 /DNA_START=9 /DNA_END=194 /DNA_ORIENTATION=+
MRWHRDGRVQGDLASPDDQHGEDGGGVRVLRDALEPRSAEIFEVLVIFVVQPVARVLRGRRG